MELGQVGSRLNEFRKGDPGGLFDPTVSVEPKRLECVDSGRSLDMFEEFYDLGVV